MKKALYGIIATVCLYTAMTGLYGEWVAMGAEHAVPAVFSFLEDLPLKEGEIYVFSRQDTEEAVRISADMKICIFELVDCMYRYLAPRRMRVSIIGDDIRVLQSQFFLGEDVTLDFIMLEDIRYIETGAVLSEAQNALDMFLDSPRSKNLEMGTAFYKKQFGFRTMSPNLFLDAYGITVKWLFVTTPVIRVEIYGPMQGAIYVKAIARPKRYYFGVISPL